ncbi:MAG: hypothetical protein AB7U34_09920, partial [Novosphingobium sp.]
GEDRQHQRQRNRDQGRLSTPAGIGKARSLKRDFSFEKISPVSRQCLKIGKKGVLHTIPFLRLRVLAGNAPLRHRLALVDAIA